MTSSFRRPGPALFFSSRATLPQRLRLRLLSAGALMVLLAACGGGGGGSSQAADSACHIAQISADTSWTQTAGPAVTLVADKTQAVAFESAAPGTVTLRADVRDATGASTTLSVDITITAPPTGSAVTLRSDQAVRPGGHASVRAWPLLAPGDALSSLTWTQTAGPAVELDTRDTRRLIFTAPAVEADTVLKFRVEMRTAQGATDSDEVLVLVENRAISDIPGSVFSAAEVSRVHPYQSAGRYADVLVECVFNDQLFFRSSGDQNLCPAGKLPLLGQEASEPSVEQVMARVLVSHDFMGANFEQFLRTQDPQGDFRRLLSGVNAVVIGAHIRPSFYHVATGAIYLDADWLWLTAEQRDVIDETPDARAANDDTLAFTSLSRYVLGDAYAQAVPSRASRASRSVANLTPALASLLYHELGHANDFFPPTERTLDPALSIFDNAWPRLQRGQLPSDALATQFPLRSAELKALALAMFFGEPLNDAQRAYTPGTVASLFAPDGATDLYNYSAYPAGANSREDLAMLFEEFMMAHRHGLRRDVAFTTPYREGQTGADLTVAWGQRGRIAQTQVKPRVRLMLQRVAPWIDPAAVDALPEPVMMRAGQSWTANLALGNAVSPAQAQASGTAALPLAPRVWPVDPNDPRLLIDAMRRRH
jgi:hypothetical protein